MIEYYLNNESLNTADKINECYEYYLKKEYSFDELYTEYDKINSLKPRLEFTDQNIFFKNDTLKRINTIFMKECLLEALKRYIETKSYTDIKDPNSELNNDNDINISDVVILVSIIIPSSILPKNFRVRCKFSLEVNLSVKKGLSFLCIL